MKHTTSQTVLILGGTGRMGRNAGQAFQDAGWSVRHFNRKQGDLNQAARGADVIVNAWNPPYTRWKDQVPALTSRVIDAARASGATVILPGNVYVFGRDTAPPWSETTPHAATNPLGRIRIAAEDSYRRSGVQTIVLRAGDFIDTRASGNWFDKIITAKLGQNRLVYPGPVDRPHAWAWLPDVAGAMVGLADMRDALDRFQDVPFPGYTLTGDELGALIGAATHRRIMLRQMNWLLFHALAPVWPMARNLVEMSYLWKTPHALDGATLARLLPGFQPTKPLTALSIALKNQINPDQPVTRRRRSLDA